jgi:hypothetical protein
MDAMARRPLVAGERPYGQDAAWAERDGERLKTGLELTGSTMGWELLLLPPAVTGPDRDELGQEHAIAHWLAGQLEAGDIERRQRRSSVILRIEHRRLSQQECRYLFMLAAPWAEDIRGKNRRFSSFLFDLRGHGVHVRFIVPPRMSKV